MYSSGTASTRDKIINTLHLGRALLLVWQSTPGWTLASAFLVMLQGILPLASLYLMKLIVDSVTAGMNSADKEAAFGHILFIIFLTASIAFLTALSRSTSGASARSRHPWFQIIFLIYFMLNRSKPTWNTMRIQGIMILFIEPRMMLLTGPRA